MSRLDINSQLSLVPWNNEIVVRVLIDSNFLDKIESDTAAYRRKLLTHLRKCLSLRRTLQFTKTFTASSGSRQQRKKHGDYGSYMLLWLWFADRHSAHCNLWSGRYCYLAVFALRLSCAIFKRQRETYAVSVKLVPVCVNVSLRLLFTYKGKDTKSGSLWVTLR